MKKVKITGTTYGYNNNGRVEPKDRHSDPFYLDDEEAERLVSLGYAEIIGDGVATPQITEEEANTVENTHNTDHGLKEAETACIDECPDYSVSMKASELREIANRFGIRFKVGTSKEEMVAKLDEYFSGDDLVLSAEDPMA